MTPFDLEKAKKGVPMKTRSGRRAKFISILQGEQPAPLVVEVRQEVYQPGTGKKLSDTTTENYYLDGRHGTVHDSPLDLFMDEGGY